MKCGHAARRQSDSLLIIARLCRVEDSRAAKLGQRCEAPMNRLSRLVPISALSLLGLANSAQGAPKTLEGALDCKDQAGYLCAEVFDSIGYNGGYTGHDEPSLLFYSNVPGSGNSGRYFLRLPKDPPTLPRQDGKGGTFNFQLHPAFWVGMALCDDQSAPNPGGSNVSPNIHCVPNSDKNIFDGSD